MPLILALLLSLALHVTLILAPDWLTPSQPTVATARVEARLVTPAKPLPAAEAVSTEAEPVDAAAVAPSPPTRPTPMQRGALHRAQAALSKHLFYPPEAIARGLEGEVILLLTLSESGQLVSVAIARSSGHSLLDQAALDAARHIGTLPGNSRQTLFPVSFRLQ